eukprot:scaffold173_cov221-Pinguiococcus_pyrenoidosus.AAC.5
MHRFDASVDASKWKHHTDATPQARCMSTGCTMEMSPKKALKNYKKPQPCFIVGRCLTALYHAVSKTRLGLDSDSSQALESGIPLHGTEKQAAASDGTGTSKLAEPSRETMIPPGEGGRSHGLNCWGVAGFYASLSPYERRRRHES